MPNGLSSWSAPTHGQQGPPTPPGAARGAKADVLLEAFLDLGEQAARAAGQEPYEIPDTGDLAADLKAVLRATVDELLDPRFEAPSRALAAAGVVDEQLGREFVGKLLEPRLQLYVDRLRCAQTQGQVRPDVDPRIALELFVSPLAQRRLQRTDRSRTATPTPWSTTRWVDSPRADRKSQVGSPACPDKAPRSTGRCEHRACCPHHSEARG